jgi:hypothetical protein
LAVVERDYGLLYIRITIDEKARDGDVSRGLIRAVLDGPHGLG